MEGHRISLERCDEENLGPLEFVSLEWGHPLFKFH